MCSESPSLRIGVCFFCAIFISSLPFSTPFSHMFQVDHPKSVDDDASLTSSLYVMWRNLAFLGFHAWADPDLTSCWGAECWRAPCAQCVAPGIRASSAVWRRWATYGLIIKASWWICLLGRGHECQSGYVNVELPNCQRAEFQIKNVHP